MGYRLAVPSIHGGFASVPQAVLLPFGPVLTATSIMERPGLYKLLVMIVPRILTRSYFMVTTTVTMLVTDLEH